MSRRIILFVSSMNTGGAERVASTLVNAWSERGDVVTLVVTYSGRGGCFYPISGKVRLIYLADMAGSVGRTPLAYWRRFRALRMLMRQTRPDVALSFLTNVNVAVILASMGLRIPVIVCERTIPEGTSGALRFFRKLTYPFADVVTVQSADVLARFATECRWVTRFEVVPNPLPAEISKFAAQRRRDSVRRTLVAMGRLSPEKQFDVLISAFARLATQYPDWDLWIWGEGPLRRQLETQIQAHNLDGRVYLPGVTSEAWTELRNADVFVLASAFEGFPNALLEAMALGVPCVAFDCVSGPRELSRDGQDALLVRPGDAVGLKTAVENLLANSDLRHDLGERASRSVRERYSIDKVLTNWDRIFETAVRSDLPILPTP